MKIVDQAIFLHRVAYSETSMVATLYSQNHGVLKCMIKGGKKKSHNLFPLSMLEVSYFQKSEHQLGNLVSADSSIPLTFQFNPIKSSIAFFIAEVIRKTMQTNQSEPEIYSFFIERITQLNDNDNVALFPVCFLVDYSKLLGIEPLINQSEEIALSIEEGEFNAPSRLIRFDEGKHIELLYQLYLSIEVTEVDKSTRTKALETMLQYFSFHLPEIGSIDSYEILKQVLS